MEGRNPNAFFNAKWYLKKYPDVAAAGIDPFSHYVQYGAFEKRSPGPLFDSKWYLETYPDIEKLGGDPLLHYIKFGAAEGRLAQPPSRLLKAQGKPALEGPAPSREALTAVKAAINRFSSLEPDLAALKDAKLEQLPVTVRRWTSRSRAWCNLYSSLIKPPRRVILLSSLNEANGTVLNLVGAAHQADDPESTLVLSTDESTAPVPDWLPRGTMWRALSDLGEPLTKEDRLALVTALLHGLRPGAVLVWDSLVGWEICARHGGPLSRLMAFFALVNENNDRKDQSEKDLVHKYFRSCIAHLSGCYCEDEGTAADLAGRYGLPGAERSKLHVLRVPLRDNVFPGVLFSVGEAGGASLRLLWIGDPDEAQSVSTVLGAVVPQIAFDICQPNAPAANFRIGRASPTSGGSLDQKHHYQAVILACREPVLSLLLHATTSGVPVIGLGESDAGSLIDENAGWHVPDSSNKAALADAINQIISNPAEAQQRANVLARRITSRHSWQAYLKTLACDPGFLGPVRTTAFRVPNG